MKKIWLTIAGSLFITLASVSAQDRSSSDTTGTGSSQSTEYQYQWRDEDRETVTRDDLPTGLVETLEGGQYEGWENATIYRNKSSNDYMLVIQDNGTTRTFYFDKEGKEHSMNSGLDNPGDKSDSSQGQPERTQSGDLQDSTSTARTGATTSSDAITIATSPSTTGSSTSDADDDDDADNDDNDATVTTSGQSTSTPTGNSTYSTTDQASTSTTTGSTTQTGSGLQTTSGDQMSNEWNKEDRVVITTNELPSALLISLGDPKYRGWENSTVYRNRKNNQYMIEIRDGSDTRTYYFDKDGKAVVNTSGNSVDE
jgi:hypothetical protein